MTENSPSADRPASSAFRGELRADDLVQPVAPAEPAGAGMAGGAAVAPEVSFVLPGPGFWAAVGWLFLLGVVNGALALAVYAAGCLLLRRPLPFLVLLAGGSSASLGTTLFLVARRLGRNAPRALAARRLGLLHAALVVLIVPPFAIVNFGLSSWARRGVEVVWGGEAARFPGEPAAAPAVTRFEPVTRMHQEVGRQSFLVVLLLGCLCPGVAEEVLFRGFLGRGLVARFGLFRGVLLTSCLFGLTHVEPALVCVTAVLGIVLHLVYLSTRSLLAPILLHTLHNLAVFSLGKWAQDTPFPALFADGDCYLPLFLAALAALVGLGFVLYRTRVRWVLPDGRTWGPGYTTAASPPRPFQAVPQRRALGIGGGLGVLGTYLLFAGAGTFTVLYPPPTAWACCQRGERAYTRHDFDEAIAQYSEALRLKPASAWAYDGRGRALGMKGDHAAALRDLTEAIRLQPDIADLYAHRAWAHNLRGEYAEALGDCDQALWRNPACTFASDTRATACNELGGQACLRGNFDEAIVRYSETIRLRPRFAWAYNGRGMAWGRKGDHAAALRDLSEAVRLEPNVAAYYANRAWIQGRRREFAEAVRDCDHALRLDAACALAIQVGGASHEELARQAYGRQDFDEAIAHADAALRLRPDSAGAHDGRGSALSMQGKHAEAIRDYTEAIRLQPGNAGYYANRARAHNLRREFAEALGDCHEALRLKPDVALAISTCVQACCELGEQAYQRDHFDEAIARHSEAIRLKPDLAQAYNGRGMALGMKGDHAAALRDFSEAVRLQPGVADFHANRAWAHSLRREFAEAVRDCDQALQRNETCAFAIQVGVAAHDELGRQALDRRDFDEVIAHANEASRLCPNFARAYSRRGVALGMKGDHAGALRDLSEAIRLEPEAAEFHAYRAWVHALRREFAAATCDGGRVLFLLLSPSARSLTLQGWEAHKRNDLDGAIARYGEAIRHNPRFAGAYGSRGVALGRKGDHAAAVRDLSEAIRLQPGVATYYANRAWAHNLGGEFAEALRDCAEALRLNPNSAFALETRAVALRGLGR